MRGYYKQCMKRQYKPKVLLTTWDYFEKGKRTSARHWQEVLATTWCKKKKVHGVQNDSVPTRASGDATKDHFDGQFPEIEAPPQFNSRSNLCGRPWTWIKKKLHPEDTNIITKAVDFHYFSHIFFHCVTQTVRRSVPHIKNAYKHLP